MHSDRGKLSCSSRFPVNSQPDFTGEGKAIFENSVTLQFRPGKTREALLVLRECVAPVIMAQKSLLGLCLLPNYEKEEATIISVWVSETRAQVLEAKAAYRKEIGKLDCFLLQPANSLAHQNSPKN